MDKQALTALDGLARAGGYASADAIPPRLVPWAEVAEAAYGLAAIVGPVDETEETGNPINAHAMLASYVADGWQKWVTSGAAEDRAIIARWARELVVFSTLNEREEPSLIAPDLPGDARARAVLWRAVLVDHIPQRWIETRSG
jgi:hypothetical protein